MSKTITTRAKAFAGRLQTIRAMVDTDGTVRVYDSVAGYYTTCHSLSDSAQRRIRKLAA
jgi:hypothetical protein